MVPRSACACRLLCGARNAERYHSALPFLRDLFPEGLLVAVGMVLPRGRLSGGNNVCVLNLARGPCLHQLSAFVILCRWGAVVTFSVLCCGFGGVAQQQLLSYAVN